MVLLHHLLFLKLPPSLNVNEIILRHDPELVREPRCYGRWAKTNPNFIVFCRLRLRSVCRLLSSRTDSRSWRSVTYIIIKFNI